MLAMGGLFAERCKRILADVGKIFSLLSAAMVSAAMEVVVAALAGSFKTSVV
ncbi:hypothetical protein [Bradyrhizobium ottawaense]|uniref:hypothetical protein n=1 Tax=Bradyrhizobium ottawaense TaxID=931866 RepID=UPI003F9EC4F5